MVFNPTESELIVSLTQPFSCADILRRAVDSHLPGCYTHLWCMTIEALHLPGHVQEFIFVLWECSLPRIDLITGSWDPSWESSCWRSRHTFRTTLRSAHQLRVELFDAKPSSGPWSVLLRAIWKVSLSSSVYPWASRLHSPGGMRIRCRVRCGASFHPNSQQPFMQQSCELGPT